MSNTILGDMTKNMVGEYTGFESWVYDTFIADAIEPYLRQMLGRFLDDVEPDAKVLDVGCGGGHLLLTVADKRPDLQLTGLDLNPGQVKRANKRIKKKGYSFRVVEGSALDLPFDEKSFDMVVSIASIKHWPDQARGLSEILRVLKPGGIYHVAEADRGCDLNDARSFVSGFRLPRPMLEIATAAFRTYVAGQSLDMDEARALSKALPATNKSVQRLEGTPILLISGRKKIKK